MYYAPLAVAIVDLIAQRPYVPYGEIDCHAGILLRIRVEVRNSRGPAPAHEYLDERNRQESQHHYHN